MKEDSNKTECMPENNWAHELSGILNNAGYTVFSYLNTGMLLQTEKDKEAKLEPIIVLRLLPPKGC